MVQGDSALLTSTILVGPNLLLSPSTAALANTHESSGKVRWLVQRMISVASRLVDNVEDIFRYEQYAYPAALLDASGFLREENKALSQMLSGLLFVVMRRPSFANTHQ